jgi:ATP-binding cassette subfamily F protein 2
MSVFHLHEEAPPSEMSGVEAVINHVVEETARLEAMVEQIMEVSTARRTSGSSDSSGCC